MTSQRVFETESIDLAAFLATEGHDVTIYHKAVGKRTVLGFAGSEELHQAIVNYERSAALPAKRLLNTRSWPFCESSRGCREVQI